MKAILPLLAIALLLAGCTTPTESEDDANGTTTNDQRGGQVEGEITAVEPGEGNASTNSTPTNSSANTTS